MSRFLVIADGRVINTVEAEAEIEGAPLMIPSDTGQIGDLYDEAAGTFTAPPAPVPESVSARQFKVALIRTGLWDAINAAVSAADIETQVTWATAQVFERSNPMLVAMVAALGYTAEQVDDVFRLAGSL